jgi:DUF4097 and DUF4098 domain-containing protein YvlB
MPSKLLIPALATSVLFLTGCDFEELAAAGRYERDFHYTYALNGNGRISLETFNGSVEISGWEQNTIDISGTKYGRTQAIADDLKVNVDHAPDAVAIRVVRPTEWHNNSGARFVIKVPRTAVLERILTSNGGIHTTDGTGSARLKTSNGAISVENLKGSLSAETSNGGVHLVDVEGDAVVHTSNGRVTVDHLKGSLEATTSNAGVHAILDRADRPVRAETSNGTIELTLPSNYTRDLRATTSNGSITLYLPQNLNANVTASTSNSSIKSEFEVQTHGEISKNRLDARIGSGGPLLDLRTSNGSIRLMKL